MPVGSTRPDSGWFKPGIPARLLLPLWETEDDVLSLTVTFAGTPRGARFGVYFDRYLGDCCAIIGGIEVRGWSLGLPVEARLAITPNVSLALGFDLFRLKPELRPLLSF